MTNTQARGSRRGEGVEQRVSLSMLTYIFLFYSSFMFFFRSFFYSLMATIKTYRPDLLSDRVVTAQPISEIPPDKYFHGTSFFSFFFLSSPSLVNTLTVLYHI